jgi:hypothetical protein
MVYTKRGYLTSRNSFASIGEIQRRDFRINSALDWLEVWYQPISRII